MQSFEKKLMVTVGYPTVRRFYALSYASSWLGIHVNTPAAWTACFSDTCLLHVMNAGEHTKPQRAHNSSGNTLRYAAKASKHVMSC